MLDVCLLVVFLGQGIADASFTKNLRTRFLKRLVCAGTHCSMGGSASKDEQLTLDELEIYRACTCLDASELTTLLLKYRALGGTRKEKRKAEENLPHLVGQKTAKNLRSSMNQGRKTTTSHGDVIIHGDGASEVTMQKIVEQPEFLFGLHMMEPCSPSGCTDQANPEA